MPNLPLLPVTLSAGSAQLSPLLDYIVQIGTFAVTVKLSPRASGSSTLTLFRAGPHSSFLLSGEDYEFVTLSQENASDFVGSVSSSGTSQTSAALATTAITTNTNKGGNTLLPVTKGRYPPFWSIRPVVAAVVISGDNLVGASDVTDTDTWTVPAGQRWRIMSCYAELDTGTATTGRQVRVIAYRQANADMSPAQLVDTGVASAASTVNRCQAECGWSNTANGSGPVAQILGASGFLLVAGDTIKILFNTLRAGPTSDRAIVFINILVEEDG